MLGVMHLDPVQLMSFLDSTDAGLLHVNAILRDPARSDSEFRKKLDGLFRELHAIKGEASAVNLMSAAQRVHALEDMVSELKKRTGLSGNDFLPILLKLDELMAHLRSVREARDAVGDVTGRSARCRRKHAGAHRNGSLRRAAARPWRAKSPGP